MAAAKTTPSPSKPKAKRLIVELPGEVHRALKAEAAVRGVSMKELVLSILKEKGFG